MASSVSSGSVADDIRVGEAIWFHIAIISCAGNPSSDGELGWILMVVSFDQFVMRC